MHRNPSVNVHKFSMIPRADVPRSRFVMEKELKTTFDSAYLVPIFCEEVLPGDTISLRMTAMVRMSTPLYPVMDNLHLESFWFFVPNRLVWSNWKKMMGERASPADSISYTVPMMTSPASGYALHSLGDYFGLPCVGQVAGAATYTHSALPFRAYGLIYNEWFKSQQLINAVTVSLADGPDTTTNTTLLKRNKRHDYFTGALPWAQVGAAVTLNLGTSAPVVSTNTPFYVQGETDNTDQYLKNKTSDSDIQWTGGTLNPAQKLKFGSVTGLQTDLSAAIGATVNAMRLSFQTQRLLERDARGGTRYTESLFSHFGVKSPDGRLQRPEYLGGGHTPINVNPVPQTSATGLTGGTTPTGFLGGIAQAVAHGHGFSQSFTEHGYILGIVNVRKDLTYGQGLRRHWSRSTRYDYYYPVFANLGEQTILNKEIYLRGDANDALVFGYQERWAEYRYLPGELTGLMRVNASGTLAAWHLADNFTSLPTLNQTFIEESATTLDRALAVASQTGKQFIGDFFFRVNAARPLPVYSVPGLIDHF